MKHNIDHLLDLYWEGETSLEDEKVLQKYFEIGDIKEEHVVYKDLFDFRLAQLSISYPGTIAIDDILEKYWEGETSVSEEQILKTYFSSNTVQDNHLVYKDLFSFYVNQSDITYPDITNSTNQVEVKSNASSHNGYLKIRRWVYAVAAVSVLVFGAVTVMKNIENTSFQHQSAMIDEIDDPEEALRVTKEALALVSTKFRSSQKRVKENMGAMEKAAIFK